MKKIFNLFNEKYIRSSSILFISMFVLNLSAYFFQFAMSRFLGPEGFGALNSILSLFSLETIPVLVVGLVIVRYVSRFLSFNEMGKLRLFIINSFRTLFIIGISFSCVVWFTQSWIKSYLQLESTTPLKILAIMIFFAFVAPVGTGLLQGMQKFYRLGAQFVTAGIVRLMLGVLLVWFGFGIGGALTASILSFMVIFVFVYQPIREILKIPSAGLVERHTKEIIAFSVPVTLAFLGQNGLIFLDLILVKHFFDPTLAGQYAASVVLGRSIYYFPGALAMAMYPMVSEAHDLDKDANIILKRCLSFTAVLSGIGVLIFFLCPSFLTNFLFGSQYPQAAEFLPYYALAMSPLALSSVYIQFHLAVHRYKFIVILLGMLALEWCLIELFHSNLKQVLIVINLCEWALFFALSALTFFQSRSNEK